MNKKYMLKSRGRPGLFSSCCPQPRLPFDSVSSNSDSVLNKGQIKWETPKYSFFVMLLIGNSVLNSIHCPIIMFSGAYCNKLDVGACVVCWTCFKAFAVLADVALSLPPHLSPHLHTHTSLSLSLSLSLPFCLCCMQIKIS